MVARAGSTTLRSLPWIVVALSASTLTAPRAFADPPTLTARALSYDYVITFEKPPPYRDDGTSETWTLKDSTGSLVCELPCRARVRAWSGYVLEGLTLRPLGSIASSVQLALPQDFGEPPGTPLRARVERAPASNGPLVLGIVSAGALVVGAGLVLGAVADRHIGLEAGVLTIGSGVILGVSGLTLGIAALVWHSLSTGATLDVSPAPAVGRSLRDRQRFGLSASGFVGSF